MTDNLPDIADAEVTVPEGEEINDFHRAIAKLNNHFTPMLNKDSARSVFEQMTQGDQTMAKYYVALKKQAEKCKFPDADDSIRSKILQTMNDKKLRREATGLAENFMKSVGKVIKTAKMENKNWRRELFRFLANYR